MKFHTYNAWLADIKNNKGKIILSLFFLALAFVATVFSSHYVDEIQTVAVPDLLLDVLPSVDLSFLFIWGLIFVFVLYIAYPLIFKPSQFHYALGMLSLFILIRAGFIILTHLKAPIGAVTVSTSQFQFLSYSNDLFFSGHTGLPFLGFLVYKESRIRYIMLCSSIVLAATVLLMHAHYSIDVASAYFITYGVYVIGRPLFSSESQVNKKKKLA